ncbi:MAG: Calx-beta domain-containing protein, partial [Verrucomicrobiota bacterium]
MYSTNVSATALAPVGITLGNSGMTVSPPNAGYINSAVTTSNQTGAIANDDYFAFTLTPTIGHSLTLTNLELSAVYSVTASSGVKASLFVRSSLDNYASDVASNSFSFVNPYTVMSIPLGAAFTQVPSNITFRVYAFDDTDTAGDGLRIDDIFVRGSIDALPPGFQQVNIVATGPNAAEPSTPGEFTVTRFGDTTAPFTVNYSIGGTAVNGVDYVTLPGQVTIGAGQSTATIAVTPIDDVFSEGIETVTLTLLADPAIAVVPPASATVNIADDLEPELSASVTAFFGFDPTRPDADGLLGTHQPSDTFDNQDSAASFNVAGGYLNLTAGYLNASTKGAAWIVLNDDQPEATNAAPPASDAALRGGVPLTIRTRLEYLSSLTTGEAAAAGVLFGLSSANRDTATGWLARVERVSGSNTGRLYLDAFVNGARGTNVISGAEFNYGNFDALWFLEVKLTEVMGVTHCQVGLIADSQIPGAGSDPSRLTSGSFATAGRAAQISGELPAGVSGLVGLHFEDNTQASPTNPLDGVGRFSNLFVYGGGGATNNEYSLQMLEDGSLALVNPASGVGAVLAPEFTTLYCASNPQLGESSVAETMHGGSTSVGLNVAKWAAKSNTQNLWTAPDQTTKVRPQSAWQVGSQVWWRYAETNGFGLKAEVVLPGGSEDPNITFHLTPTTSGYYSTAFSGIPACPTNSLDWLWQPLIWQGLRFPLTGYLTPEYLCSLPGVMLSHNGAVMGAVADPGEMPFRLPLFANSLFGVVLRGPDSLAQPMVFAPLLGGTNSYLTAGSTFNFSTHVFARSGDFYQNFRRLTTNTFGFHDYRQNATATLNQVLDNMSDYFLTSYANWDTNARGFSGLRDDPDTVKSYSPVHVLSWAMVRDSQQFYEVRARPVIEYSLSRSTYFLSIGSYNANEAMFGPVLSSLTPEYCALHLITGGRTAYFGKVVNDLNATLLSAVNTNTTYTGQQALDNGRSYLRRSLAMFRMSGASAYLAEARKCADDYIAWRIAQPQTDFYDTASSFWAFVGPMWTDLLELYDETGEPRYRDAALAGAREFVGYNYFCPKIPAGDITVNIGGSVSGMSIPQETVPAWRVSEMGLQCEAAATSLSHRGIFMVPWAAYFNRLAALSGDTYLR